MNKHEYDEWVDIYSVPSKILILKFIMYSVIAYFVMVPFVATKNPVLAVLGVLLFVIIPLPSLIKFVKLFILELKSFKKT